MWTMQQKISKFDISENWWNWKDDFPMKKKLIVIILLVERLFELKKFYKNTTKPEQ